MTFFLLFQYGKRFCLWDHSLFGQNIHRLDARCACSMTSYGRIEEFLPAQVDWITYAEKLSYYFKANSITDANRKKTLLFSLCGMETFSLLKDLITPDSFRDKTSDELSQALDEHCNLALSVIVEQINVYMCRQQPIQNISDFITHFKE